MACRPTAMRIFIGVVLLVFLFTGLLACDKPTTAAVMAEPSSAVVTRYFEALQHNDYAAANACLDGGTQNVFAMTKTTGSPLDTFYAQLLQHLRFELSADPLQNKTASAISTAVKVQNGNTDNVSVTITAMNVPVLFDAAMDTLSKTYAESLVNATPIPEETLEPRLYEMLAESIADANAPSLSGTLIIRVVQTDGAWRIIADSTLYNAVTGNFLQIVNRVPEWEP